jgi:AcrR family transcriptional regulator
MVRPARGPFLLVQLRLEIDSKCASTDQIQMTVCMMTAALRTVNRMVPCGCLHQCPRETDKRPRAGLSDLPPECLRKDPTSSSVLWAKAPLSSIERAPKARAQPHGCLPQATVWMKSLQFAGTRGFQHEPIRHLTDRALALRTRRLLSYTRKDALWRRRGQYSTTGARSISARKVVKVASDSEESTYQIRRSEVLNAAVNLFYERGYSATTIGDIADAVNLLKGSLYYYARSKQELLYEIINQVHEVAVDISNHVVSEPAEDSAEQLTTIIRRMVRFSLTDSKKVAIYFSEEKHLTVESRRVFLPQRLRFFQTLRDLVDHGRSTGQFRKDIDSRIAATLVIGAINQVTLSGNSTWEGMTEDEVVGSFVDRIMHSLWN